MPAGRPGASVGGCVPAARLFTSLCCHLRPARLLPPVFKVTAAEATVRDHTAALPPATLAGQDAGGGGAAAAAAATGRLVHPIQQGSIVDWDVLEACVDHVLYDRVRKPPAGVHLARAALGRGGARGRRRCRLHVPARPQTCSIASSLPPPALRSLMRPPNRSAGSAARRAGSCWQSQTSSAGTSASGCAS